jgi:hypothetical protein
MSNTTTTSEATGKKFELDPDNKCGCEKCCCHTKVGSKGEICNSCAQSCQKYLLVTGGLETAKKGGAGLGS